MQAPQNPITGMEQAEQDLDEFGHDLVRKQLMQTRRSP